MLLKRIIRLLSLLFSLASHLRVFLGLSRSFKKHVLNFPNWFHSEKVKCKGEEAMLWMSIGSASILYTEKNYGNFTDFWKVMRLWKILAIPPFCLSELKKKFKINTHYLYNKKIYPKTNTPNKRNRGTRYDWLYAEGIRVYYPKICHFDIGLFWTEGN